MKSHNIIIGLSVIPVLLSSCIAQDYSNCNAGGTVTISVKDKNYDNIGEVDGLEKVDENLPFESYIDPLFLQWNNEGAGTGYSFRVPVLPSEKNHTLNTAFLPAGANGIFLTGNENITADLSVPEFGERELHPSGGEYNDIYIGSADITMPSNENHVIWMYRAKGMLMIKFIGLPQNIASVEVTVGGIFSKVGKGMNYSGSATVTKTFDSAQLASNFPLELMLAPSVAPGDSSPITIKVTGSDGEVTLLSNIKVNIERNKITLIKPEYNPQTGEWEISALVEGNWVVIDNLHIF